MSNSSFQQTTWEAGEPLSSKKLEQMAHNDYIEYTYANENPKGMVGYFQDVNETTYPKTYAIVATIKIDAVASRIYLVEFYSPDQCTVSGDSAIYRMFVNGKARCWVYSFNNSSTGQNSYTNVYMHYVWRAPDKIESNPYTITVGARSYNTGNRHTNTIDGKFLWVTDIGTSARTEQR